MYRTTILQESEAINVFHCGQGILIKEEHLIEALEIFGVWHTVAWHMADLDSRTKSADPQVRQRVEADRKKAKRLEQGTCRTFARFFRRALWPGHSYRTINALGKGQKRPLFHRMRCMVADGE